jgi:hypothetical protein
MIAAADQWRNYGIDHYRLKQVVACRGAQLPDGAGVVYEVACKGAFHSSLTDTPFVLANRRLRTWLPNILLPREHPPLLTAAGPSSS